jgi:heat shock protein HtpX
MGSTVKTTLLLAALTAMFVLIGNAAAGTGGMMLALGLGVAMNASAYWFSDRVALSMAGARQIQFEEAPGLHRLIDRLASQAKLPKPRVYLMDIPSPNAFATGRDPSHAAVAVTTGMLQLLAVDELSAVLAHEMAHIRNRDTLVSAVVATIAGAITMIASLAQWALMFGGIGRSDDEDEGGGISGLVGTVLTILLAPIAATLIQLAISRTREYSADAMGACIVGDPLPLARALEKLDINAQKTPMKVNPASAHQFTVPPLAEGALMGLYSTHPPTWDRVSRLSEMALRALPSL